VGYREGYVGVWPFLGGYEMVGGGRPFSGERVAGEVPLFSARRKKILTV
jgi:hypothetical protein